MNNYLITLELQETELKRLRAKEKELTRAYAEMCVRTRVAIDEIDKMKARISKLLTIIEKLKSGPVNKKMADRVAPEKTECSGSSAFNLSKL